MIRTMRSLAVLWLAAVLAAPAAAQRPAPRVLVFDAALQGRGEAELRWPVAVAAGPALEVAVADAWGSRLVIFSAEGGGWDAGRSVPLDAPPRAVLHDGRRYVVALGGRGELATVDGTALGTLDLPPGTVPGALSAAPEGSLLVYDAAGGRVLALDDAGRPGVETPVEGHVTGLAAAPGGFYAAFAEEARVRRYAGGGRMVDDFPVPGQAPIPAWPDGIVVEPGGGLLVADRHGHRIVALGGAGRLVGVGSGKGWNTGRLFSPTGIARLPDGRLIVADRGNGRVQVFSVRLPSGPRRPDGTLQ